MNVAIGPGLMSRAAHWLSASNWLPTLYPWNAEYARLMTPGSVMAWARSSAKFGSMADMGVLLRCTRASRTRLSGLPWVSDGRLLEQRQRRGLNGLRQIPCEVVYRADKLSVRGEVFILR